MNVTVADLMDLDIFHEDLRLLAGSEGTGNRVASVTVQEAPDFYEWVEGGEFVLTTWYAFYDKPDRGLAVFRSLAGTVAAIGIKTGRFLQSVPEEFKAIAKEMRLPLFSIRPEGRFKNIIQKVAGEIHHHQTNLLIEVNSWYEKLVRIGLNTARGTEEAMLTEFSSLNGLFCFAFSSDRRSVYIPSVLHAADKTRRLLENTAFLHEVPLKRVWMDENRHLYFFPCATERFLYGYLAVRSREGLTEKIRLMINQLVTILTLKWTERQATEQRFLTSLLEDLFGSNAERNADLPERLQKVGLDPQGCFRVMLVRGERETTNLQSVLLFLTGMFPKSFYAFNGTEEACVLTNVAEGESDRPPDWDGLAAYLNDSPEVVVTVSSVVEGLKEIATAHEIARQSMRAAVASGAGGLNFYARYLPHLCILRGAKSPEARLLRSLILDPLLQYDRQYNARLLDTLNQVAFDDDLKQSASALHIHINTLRYRLKRIADLTGFDFHRSNQRYSLVFAILLHRMTQST